MCGIDGRPYVVDTGGSSDRTRGVREEGNSLASQGGISWRPPGPGPREILSVLVASVSDGNSEVISPPYRHRRT
jgi:hypothetical protein